MDESFGPAALAIYLGDIAELRSLLALDPSLAVRASSVGHPTLLQLVACDASQIVDPLGAAEALVRAGAPTGAPLVAAAGCGSRSVVEYLLEARTPIDGEDPRWTPLDEALYWDQTDICELLVRSGASIRALSTAAGLGDLASIDRFVVDGVLTDDAGPIGSPFPDTIPVGAESDPQAVLDHAFVMAVNAGSRDAAARLLDEGAVINSTPPGYHWRGTALHAAVWRGDTELVEWLLRCGADPSIRDGLADSDAEGWARHHGHDELAQRLAALER